MLWGHPGPLIRISDGPEPEGRECWRWILELDRLMGARNGRNGGNPEMIWSTASALRLGAEVLALGRLPQLSQDSRAHNPAGLGRLR